MMDSPKCKKIGKLNMTNKIIVSVSLAITLLIFPKPEMDCSSTTELHKLDSLYLKESVKELERFNVEIPMPKFQLLAVYWFQGVIQQGSFTPWLHDVSLSLPPHSVSPYPSPPIFTLTI